VGEGYSYLLVQETLEETTTELSQIISSYLRSISTIPETEIGEENFTGMPRIPGYQFRETQKALDGVMLKSGSERTRRISRSTFTDHAVRHIEGGRGEGGGEC
jgi:hypothetical protein